LIKKSKSSKIENQVFLLLSEKLKNCKEISAGFSQIEKDQTERKIHNKIQGLIY
jgi:hypothetical protein